MTVVDEIVLNQGEPPLSEQQAITKQIREQRDGPSMAPNDLDAILWERRGEIDVCRACEFVREGTAAATLAHHARCPAAVVYGKMRAALERAVDGKLAFDREMLGISFEERGTDGSRRRVDPAAVRLEVAPMPAPFLVVFEKQDDGRQRARVEHKGEVFVGDALSVDGDAADRAARGAVLFKLAALAEAGKPLPPEVEALFARSFR